MARGRRVRARRTRSAVPGRARNFNDGWRGCDQARTVRDSLHAGQAHHPRHSRADLRGCVRPDISGRYDQEEVEVEAQAQRVKTRRPKRAR